MRYFLDTEFIENGKTIDLISIGLVCEDGREYYAINSECDFDKADDWVVKNVLNPIGLDRRGFFREPDYENYADDIAYRDLYEYYKKTKNQVIREIKWFLGFNIGSCQFELSNYCSHDKQRYLGRTGITKTNYVPEFWANYCSYDWVVFCQLFGKMTDLPSGFPMYCNDIQQLRTTKGGIELPQQKSGLHNALEDARYVKESYEYLQNKK